MPMNDWREHIRSRDRRVDAQLKTTYTYTTMQIYVSQASGADSMRVLFWMLLNQWTLNHVHPAKLVDF